jgi:hypothetical protein
MIILDLLKFFSRLPSREGVNDIFTNGRSRFPEYLELQEYIRQLPPPVLPEIQSLVFGQSLEAVKRRVDKITGTYLFVDFGEFESERSGTNSIEDTQRLAVTLAMKVTNSADIVEEVLVSDKTLEILNHVRAYMIAYKDQCPWLELLSKRHSIIPFESKELNSIGWTLMFDMAASDWFNVKELTMSYVKSNQ